MKFWPIFILYIIAIVSPSFAQNTTTQKQHGTIYAGLSYAQPIGDFRDKYPGGWAGGGTVGALVKPYAGHPLELGLEGSYLAHGIDLNDVYSAGDSYTLKTVHSIIPLHGVVRFKPWPVGKIIPYFDGLAGTTILNSRTKIKEPWFSVDDDEEAIVVRKDNSTVFSYGLAAGIHFAVNKNRTNFIDLRVIYREGSSARYVRRGQVTVDAHENPNYNFTRSETSMVLLQLNYAGYLTQVFNK